MRRRRTGAAAAGRRNRQGKPPAALRGRPAMPPQPVTAVTRAAAPAATVMRRRRTGAAAAGRRNRQGKRPAALRISDSAAVSSAWSARTRAAPIAAASDVPRVAPRVEAPPRAIAAPPSAAVTGAPPQLASVREPPAAAAVRRPVSDVKKRAKPPSLPNVAMVAPASASGSPLDAAGAPCGYDGGGGQRRGDSCRSRARLCSGALTRGSAGPRPRTPRYSPPPRGASARP